MVEGCRLLATWTYFVLVCAVLLISEMISRLTSVLIPIFNDVSLVISGAGIGISVVSLMSVVASLRLATPERPRSSRCREGVEYVVTERW